MVLQKTPDFILGEIANDFRFYFIKSLSDKALSNSWKSSIKVETNEEQNAFFFTQSVQYDTGRVIEGVYRDIQDTLKSLRELGFEFNAKTTKKGYSIEVTEIRYKD
ncbi:hypothetical protein ACNSOL_12450 (plasmid) [Aliarcobacter lanthieri]|uniref:hypothetical protein n=1 Tax=Aliarcobacter lanthieri TaxID=1355374 RepID=UPI003AAB1DA5